MKNQTVLYQFNLFALLLCIAMVTSCLELVEPEEKASGQLLGKWYLVRVEEPARTVSPPTDSLRVWIVFEPAPNVSGQQPNAEFSVKGENLANLYGGIAFFNSAEAAGALAISSLGTTKRGGPAPYLKFDNYYLRLLEKAASYAIKDETLIIWTENEEMLLFVR